MSNCISPILPESKEVSYLLVKDIWGLIDLAIKSPRRNAAPKYFSKFVIYNHYVNIAVLNAHPFQLSFIIIIVTNTIINIIIVINIIIIIITQLTSRYRCRYCYRYRYIL